VDFGAQLRWKNTQRVVAWSLLETVELEISAMSLKYMHQNQQQQQQSSEEIVASSRLLIGSNEQQENRREKNAEQSKRQSFQEQKRQQSGGLQVRKEAQEERSNQWKSSQESRKSNACKLAPTNTGSEQLEKLERRAPKEARVVRRDREQAPSVEARAEAEAETNLGHSQRAAGAKEQQSQQSQGLAASPKSCGTGDRLLQAEQNQQQQQQQHKRNKSSKSAKSQPKSGHKMGAATAINGNQLEQLAGATNAHPNGPESMSSNGNSPQLLVGGNCAELAARTNGAQLGAKTPAENGKLAESAGGPEVAAGGEQTNGRPAEGQQQQMLAMLARDHRQEQPLETTGCGGPAGSAAGEHQQQSRDQHLAGLAADHAHGAPEEEGAEQEEEEEEEEDGAASCEGRKMFVGGLSWQTTGEGLRDYFGKFGQIVEAMIMNDPATRRSR